MSEVIKNQKAIVVFSGYNDRAVLAFLRTISLFDEVQCGVIAKGEGDKIFNTRYRDLVFHTRTKGELNVDGVIDVLSKYKQRSKCDEIVIIPSSEFLNRFFLQNRELLIENDIDIALTNMDLYCQISDKITFEKLCLQHHIKTPRKYDKYVDAQVPFVAKPRRYADEEGRILKPVLICSNAERQAFESEGIVDSYYYQQFVTGDSYYLLYYFNKNSECTLRFSQQNLIQQPCGGSIIAAQGAKLHESSQGDVYEKMLNEVGFRGLIMIEVRCNDEGCYMIEANPRLWGPSQLFVDAGVNFFTQLLLDYNLIDVAAGDYKINGEQKYCWVGGFNSEEFCDTSRSVIYHGYSATEFVGNLEDWVSADVYKRQDNYIKEN